MKKLAGFYKRLFKNSHKKKDAIDYQEVVYKLGSEQLRKLVARGLRVPVILL